MLNVCAGQSAAGGHSRATLDPTLKVHDTPGDTVGD
jgi:hypothetical protein